MSAVMIMLLLPDNNATVCAHAFDPSNLFKTNLYSDASACAWFDISAKAILGRGLWSQIFQTSQNVIPNNSW